MDGCLSKRKSTDKGKSFIFTQAEGRHAQLSSDTVILARSLGLRVVEYRGAAKAGSIMTKKGRQIVNQGSDTLIACISGMIEQIPHSSLGSGPRLLCVQSTSILSN